MGPRGLTVLRPASHQSPVRPSQTTSCSVRPFPALPPHSASSLVLSARACFPLSATRQSSHLSSSEPLAASWIFPVRYSYPALISINPSVDLRVHCVVHLVSDHFPHRSSGRLVEGKAAKGVAPVPSSETKCYTPAKRCGVAQYLGRERRGFPKEKIT